MNIPAVVGLHNVTLRVKNGDFIIVDGTDGEVIVNPPPVVRREFLSKKEKYDKYRKDLQKTARLESRTLDGVPFVPMANIELPEEVSLARSYGAEGVGLFRSEFIYLGRIDPADRGGPPRRLRAAGPRGRPLARLHPDDRHRRGKGPAPAQDREGAQPGPRAEGHPLLPAEPGYVPDAAAGHPQGRRPGERPGPRPHDHRDRGDLRGQAALRGGQGRAPARGGAVRREDPPRRDDRGARRPPP